ncbi:Outer membrane protein TolC [Zhongshania aliphaticivorans]|uniref:Outer membrane protein TolC n=1 Tax=Zhongshania aliphaticivorans TaxID=1470434 RepID=A0A5S9Q7E6_9GAMM|nr:TolC family outer membrane protein [Zhongshania aliphaticivorans]CAA0103260.1 Outer membrane protein TolC [Zhongshania aliphaticivorans]CAA0113651.1 Outer membrane protein TolC [Zhongshania aliphaticivorans]
MIAKRHLLSISIAALLSSQIIHAETLFDVYQLAVNNDPELKAAEATYRANIETEKLSRAALLPQITAQAYYQDSETESQSKSITSNNLGQTSVIDQHASTDSETENYSVSLNQALFDLPAWFSFKAGKKVSEQAEAQLAYEQQQLIVRTAEAYFNVLRGRENLDASKAEERAAKRQLEQTQQRFDVGLIAITDVHEARAVFDSTVAQRYSFEGTLAIARENLSSLTGQEHNNLWSLKKDFPITMPEPSSRAEWVDFALENNKLLQVSNAGASSAYQTAQAKKMEHLPKIAGSFSYTKNDLDGTTIYNPSSTFALPPDSYSETDALRITLTMPLFSGGGTSASRRQAYEQYNAANYNAQTTQRQVITNTRAQHIAVYTDVQTVNARHQNIISTRSALDATEAGYDVGTRNIVDVLNAQRSFYAATRDYTNARYDYVIDVLKLKLNAGTLSPADIIALNKWLQLPEPVTLNGSKTNKAAKS